ncbi:hypothetical protein [Pelagibius sp.]|uniref:hypothetical protein n=1 Tax=Pelagibius sp. TaxID=1931238 RepID=UPI003B514EB1
MPYFLLGIALLVGALFFARWFVDADPRRVATVAKIAGAVFLGGLALLLVISGRISLLMMLLVALVFMRRVLKAARQQAQAMHGPSPGQASEVRTRFLHMALDHDTGRMDGEILDGRFMGMWLSQLSLADLLTLLEDYRAEDEESASVLEAFIDRNHQEDWRGQESAGGTAGGEGERAGTAANGPMSREEALEILGLEEGASAVQIREAHRRLMQKIHPDHGGSNYLAAKLNEAKDLLLST